MKNSLVFLLSVFLILPLEAGPRKPTITGQSTLSISEEGSITISLNHLRVQDPDNFFYPLGFTMKLYEGANYTFSGHTVTPAPNFHGTLKVRVTVNDGYSDSDPYDLVITVVPVNDPPVITGQKALSTEQGKAITLKLNDLTVSDPDNDYPKDFTMSIQPGDNYSVNGYTITPSPGFTGDLTVRLTVSDGMISSPLYNLSINVFPGNKKPVITGQTPLSIAKDQSIVIELAHLTVTDPDDAYPQDFTLILFAGANYTYSGHTVTPAPGFTGVLVVKVAVNDGHSSSEPFQLKIDVKDQIAITKQEPVSIDEDGSLVIGQDMYTVYDPNNQYPAGYLLKIDPGENYTVDGNTVRPAPDFFGELSVGISVTNGTYTSPVFVFAITVVPVNDAPRISDFPESPVRYAIGSEPVKIFSAITVEDPDHEHLIFAEVGLLNATPGEEVLTVSPSGNINAVFDETSATLTLVGQATLAQYEETLESIEYAFANEASAIPGKRMLTVRLNDGSDASITYERELLVAEDFDLDIPTVFTPNDDNANDTWRIYPASNSERYSRSVIRVYDRRGQLVFETSGFEKEWDGRYNGNALPGGPYYFTIDLNLNYATNRIRGVVTLLK